MQDYKETSVSTEHQRLELRRSMHDANLARRWQLKSRYGASWDLDNTDWWDHRHHGGKIEKRRHLVRSGQRPTGCQGEAEDAIFHRIEISNARPTCKSRGTTLHSLSCTYYI
ncbi:uncharacterized protein LOC122533577 isoform X1 [Frieseomelitta varia]|uniref:uncharacterized protein LOC122533577 isoform X1 n=1 Tax=Frieseomelitta varia TaxID=561572 RepID=UPI001CB692AB|nr:uncharacterized protein LOC122533577 isoform X1 [Frieseomelitta varia]